MTAGRINQVCAQPKESLLTATPHSTVERGTIKKDPPILLSHPTHNYAEPPQTINTQSRQADIDYESLLTGQSRRLASGRDAMSSPGDLPGQPNGTKNTHTSKVQCRPKAGASDQSLNTGDFSSPTSCDERRKRGREMQRMSRKARHVTQHQQIPTGDRADRAMQDNVVQDQSHSQLCHSL